MKLRGEVIEVSSDGDHLRVGLQTQGEVDAAWRAMGKCVLELPQHEKTARTFYLGRIVSITVTAKP